MEPSSSDEQESCTFVHVLSEKYNPDNFPYGYGVVVKSSPPGSPIKGEGHVRVSIFRRLNRYQQLIALKTLTSPNLFADRLFLPSTLVLDHCGITKAGDGSYIAAFCPHVVELDLSSNQLNDWVEVSLIPDPFSRVRMSSGCCWHDVQRFPGFLYLALWLQRHI